MRVLGRQSNNKQKANAAEISAISMFNINEFIASALFNVLSEANHTSDILTHCAPMPNFKLLEVFNTPFSFKGESQVSYGDNFYGEGSLDSLFDGIT